MQIAPAKVTSAELLGDPGCGGDVPSGMLCVRTMSFVVRVRFHLAGGAAKETSQFCGINSDVDFGCTETPKILVGSPLQNGGGYHDVPCTGEPPAGCPTPMPSLNPTAVADAKPLRVASLDIPVDHAGAYRIRVGAASLPNGILSVASALVDDADPGSVVVSPEGMWLEVIPDKPGAKPIWNIYDHPWRRGVEAVHVELAFTVEMFEPGAVLHVRDLLVR